MWKLSGTSLLVAALHALLTCQAAWACGPFFPNTIIDQGDRELLSAPHGRFLDMAAELTPQGKPEFQATLPGDLCRPHNPTAETDLAELRAALAELKLPARKADAIVGKYGSARQAILAFANENDRMQRFARDNPKAPRPPVLGQVEIPAGLPAEFEQYLRGAVLYHQGKAGDARKCWQAVLDLPAGQSRYRATWAAYMIARSEIATDPAAAVKHFPKVRELAKAGYRDSLGLAVASYGWQARAELAQGHFEEAVDLYLMQYQAGDFLAQSSLQYTCGAILGEKPAILQRVAKHDPARQLVTAYIVSKGGPFAAAPERATELAWLGAVESAGLKDVRDADTLAWAAYAAGQYKTARRWLDRCGKDTAASCWVESKLLLRAGKPDEAAAKLAKAVKLMSPTAGPWQIDEKEWEIACFGPYYADRSTAAGELATLKLHRSQYVEALDLLYRNGWWTDAALVADRILTVAELVKYVDKNWPKPLGSRKDQRDVWAGNKAMPIEPQPPQPAGDLRHLLARRLVRKGQLELAARYMPNDLQKHLDEYTRQLAAGNDPKQPKARRADALWKAAQTMREHGMELMGYELEPDAFIWDGCFEYGLVETRLKGLDEGTYVNNNWVPRIVQPKIAPASADEKKRIADSQAKPNKRFHYRYKAADLAWQAAEMMPDESDQTATVLCEAGTWLKIRDPKAADRFYKALVRRCGQTRLGRQAQADRWFPSSPAASQAVK